MCSSTRSIASLTLIAIVVYLLLRMFVLSFSGSTVLAKASIVVDLSLPQLSLRSSRMSAVNHTFERNQRKQLRRTSVVQRGPGARYMLQLYHRQNNADVVKALRPIHVSLPLDNGFTIIEFNVPSAKLDETLEAAELLSVAGMILRVYTLDDKIAKVEKTRKDDYWRAFDVTETVATSSSSAVKLLVRGTVQRGNDSPILLLKYRKSRRRRVRSVYEHDDQEERSAEEERDGGRRKRRNSCRRRPMYVDFSLIAFDEWVVAPPGYEAYQCTGKCFYPFGEHLNPTKHAIVQTLIHGAVQSIGGFNSKSVGRACCVPTKLASTSLLYLDASGTLTYQYGYEDMVVLECGCR